MPEVVAFLGSPRRGGNSELLLDKAIAGAQKGGASVEKIVLAELTFAPCNGCEECAATGVCTLHDDMSALYPKLEQAAGLILAAPTYFLGLPAQTKAFIDRCQALWAKKYRLKQPIARHKGRRGLFIGTAAWKSPRVFQGSLMVVRAFFATLEVASREELLYGGLEERGAIAKRPEALEEAFQAGWRIVSPEGRETTLVAS